MRPANIAEAIAQLGIDGPEREGEITTRCPLHSDSSPSFAINVDTGLWICYAGCGSGNIRTLAQKVLGLNGTELNRWTHRLRTLGGAGFSAAPRAGAEQQYDIVDEDAWLRVTQSVPDEYLIGRGITKIAADELGLRFNPWNPDKETGKPGSDPCWMIPLRHPEEHYLIGWQTKGTTGDRQAITTGKKGYTLFGIELVTPGKDIVVVEAPLDVAHARTFMYANWVGTCGSSVSIQQIELLRVLLSEGGRLIVAADNDEAGDKMAKKLLGAKALAGIPRVRFEYGTGTHKDPGTMSLQEIGAGLEGAR